VQHLDAGGDDLRAESCRISSPMPVMTLAHIPAKWMPFADENMRQLEHFPEKWTRFSARKCDKNKGN
jgi:hypothetical protein